MREVNKNFYRSQGQDRYLISVDEYSLQDFRDRLDKPRPEPTVSIDNRDLEPKNRTTFTDTSIVIIHNKLGRIRLESFAHHIEHGLLPVIMPLYIYIYIVKEQKIHTPMEHHQQASNHHLCLHR